MVLRYLCVALIASVASVSVRAERLLVIHKSVRSLKTAIEPLRFENRRSRPEDDYQWARKPGNPAGSVALTLAVSPIAGVGYAIAQMEAARERHAEPLLEQAGVAADFERRMFEIVRSELATQSVPVDRTVVTKAHGTGVPLSAASPDEDVAILIRPTGTNLVSLTANDRRLVVNLTVELYTRGSDTFRRGVVRKVMYLSRPIDEAGAIDRWAENGAALFWSELEQGMRLSLGTALADVKWNAVPGLTGTTLIKSANAGEEFDYRAWRRDGDLLYLTNSRDSITIIHDTSAPTG